MMNKKWQRITAIVIALLLALAMILSLVVPAFAAEDYSQEESGDWDDSEDGDWEDDEADEDREDEGASGEDEADGGARQAAPGSEQTLETEKKTLPGADCLRLAGDVVILDGVTIGDVDVSGMSGAEAATAVAACSDRMSKATLTLRSKDDAFNVPIEKLGYTWQNTNVAEEALALGNAGNILERYICRKELEHEGKTYRIERTFDEETVATLVEDLANEVNVKSVPFTLAFNDDYDLYVTGGTEGYRVMTQESINQLMIYLDTGWVTGSPVMDLAAEITQPKGDKEALSKIHDLLGSAETDYSESSDARAKNVLNGVKLISGTVLYPGESLSVLDLVVPFNEENGYALAPSYAEGSVVETYGGGICQVSTTLYMALLRAEIQIDMRCAHSMIVNYVVPAMDAAISEEGGKDLQFTNNLADPIFIYGSAWDGNLYFGVYGVETRPEDRSVSFRSETMKETPIATKITEDYQKPMGEVGISSGGHTGVEARLWKNVTENGKTTSTDFNYSEYEMSPLIYVVGCKTSSQAALNAVESAVATNNINRVYQALNDYGY